MAYDKENRRLYIEQKADGTKVGIALWEIADCINEHRVNKKGNRDVGILCTSPKINPMAIYRPIDTTVSSYDPISYGQRQGARFGMDITTTPDENEYTLYHAELVPKPMTMGVYRVRDFDGYNHAALFGLQYQDTGGNTILKYSNLTGAKVRGYNQWQDNISTPEVKEILAYYLSRKNTGINEWGVLLWCDTGHIILDQNKGSHANLLESDTEIKVNQSNINNEFKVNVPKNKNAFLGVYFTDEDDFKYVINPSHVRYETINDGFIIDVNRFASHTYIANCRTGDELANWREVALDVYGKTVDGTNWDQICFACNLKNLGDDISLPNIMMKITITGGPASIRGKVFYHSLTFPNISGYDFDHGDETGTDAYKGADTQLSDYAFYMSTQPMIERFGSTIYGSSLTFTMQLVLMKTWATGNQYRILSSPLTFAIRFNNATCPNTPLFQYENGSQKIDENAYTQED